MAGRSATSLRAVAEPVLTGLATTAGEAAGLGVRDYFDVLYTADIQPDVSVQVRTWVGERIPMHAVPSGTVLLSGFDDEDLNAFLARPLRPFTERTVVDADTIRERISSFHRHGVAWGRGEFASDINSVAAAIHNRDGAVVAAVYLHGPAYRFPMDHTDVYESLVIEAGSIISAAIAEADVVVLRDFDSA
jgi:DNA-binding IclR family transcriptional regulator